MAYIYEIPISLFPGGVAPDNWEEFILRVNEDPGIVSTSLESPFWRPVEYGVSVGLYFGAEPTGDDRDPGPATLEKLIIDNLAAASPDAPTTAAELTFRGYFEDFGPDTSTTGLAVRMQETPTFLAGRYEIGWTSQVNGTLPGGDIVPRFFFDGALVMDADIDAAPVTPRGFSGRIERVLTAGSWEMRLEIERVAGGGSAEMRYSTMWYKYIAVD